MKLSEMDMGDIYGGKKIRRGKAGPNVHLNPEDHCLWYFDGNGVKIFPITFGDMLADDWHLVD